jgi:CBS domain-containing protein
MVMKAHDVMTWGVISVEVDAPVMRAVQLMLENRISGLPVVDAKGTLVGIVTEGDFLRRIELGTQRRRSRWLDFLIGPGRLATEYVRASGRKVNEIMTLDPYTITEDASLVQIVQLMEKRRIKRVPVVDDGKLIGLSAGRIFCMRSQALRARRSRRPAMIRPFVSEFSPNSLSNPGRPPGSSMSLSAMASSNSGARSWMIGSGKPLSSWPRTYPG